MESYNGIIEISFFYSVQLSENEMHSRMFLCVLRFFLHMESLQMQLLVLQTHLTHQVTERSDTKQGGAIRFSNTKAQQFKATVVSTNHIYSLC